MRVLRNYDRPAVAKATPEAKHLPSVRGGKFEELRPGKGRHPTNKRIAAGPEHLPPPPMPDPTPDLLKQELLHLDTLVLTGILGGLGPRQTARVIMKDNPNRWSYDTVYQAITRQNLEITQDAKELGETTRAVQIARLQQDLARMRSQPRPNFMAIRGHEELFARITGTLKPVRVEVDVMATLKQSVAAVIVDLSEEQRDSIVAEQLELEAERRARQLPPPQAAE